jgi:Flp pilus assembly pilin Flp
LGDTRATNAADSFPTESGSGKEKEMLASVYRQLWRVEAGRQEGQALIEYALIVSLVALMAIASLKLAGTNVSSILNKIAGEV